MRSEQSDNIGRIDIKAGEAVRVREEKEVENEKR